MGTPGRLRYIDLLRGWAIILMFETHAYHAWCDPAAKQTVFYMLTRMLGGLAAPLFLFLAGLSLVLMEATMVRKGLAPGAIRRVLFTRCLWIFAAAFLFRIQAYLFQLGVAKWEQILRVDILNCIGLALLLIAALLQLPQRYHFGTFSVLAAGVALMNPLVFDLELRQYLPRLLADYINGPPPWALFPIFPWAGFALAGAALGTVLLRHRADSGSDRSFMRWLLIASIATFAASWALHLSPVHLYPRYDFWRTSPQYFAIRLASIGILMTACYAWRLVRPAPRFSLLEQMGRHSLLLYWVHVEIVYGRASALIKGRQSVELASLWLLALAASMLALSFLPDNLRNRRRLGVTAN
ncbi:MAG: heparan-alpha-glucosaminide N-acetyltransferase domain-containing protein [Acidobacteriota bacterium]